MSCHEEQIENTEAALPFLKNIESYHKKSKLMQEEKTQL